MSYENQYRAGVGEVLLVNLSNGKTVKYDSTALYGGWRPDGYVIVEDLTVKDWCEAIKAAKESK